MRGTRLLALLGGVVALGGCTGVSGSYVAALPRPGDADVLGQDAAEFVASRLPPGATTLVLDPASGAGADVLQAALATALRRRGFAVQEGPVPADAHRLRTVVTSLDGGELLRLSLDGSTDAARFFARDAAGDLRPGGPFTMQQAEATP